MSAAAEPAARPRAGERLAAIATIAGGAIVLRLIAGVGFVNYDTLYALAWGGQLSRGETPAYELQIAPTPHPLLEALGLVLAPFGARTASDVTVALGFLALAACGWVLYRLGSMWFSRAAGALAAIVFLTRVPVLSYGVRAYVDLPYLLLVLMALAAESGSRRAGRGPGGTPVLALLALAGLLRPEAWAFSGLYWLALVGALPRTWRERFRAGGAAPERARLVRWTLLASCAPLVWLASDLLVTGHPLWSLTNTRHTASTLDRAKGAAKVPEYIPRRIGEILRPAGLAGAALGGVLSLAWLRGRAIEGALAGVVAVLVFALFAALGLPINSRYAFLSAAVLAIFCGAGVFGWLLLARDDRRRRWWLLAGAAVLAGLVVSAPSQYRSADRELDKLARQSSIEGDLTALVRAHVISTRCGPVGVPNHAPIPLLALYLKTSPARIVNAQVGRQHGGIYIDPASREVEDDYVLDPHDPRVAVSVPPGFAAIGANRSWLVFGRCS